MSWRKNPNPTIKPPFGSYIDWSHPLADRLLYCCILNEYTGRPSNMIHGRIAIENTMQWSGEFLEGADAQYCTIPKNPNIDSVREYTIVSDGEFYDTSDGCLFCHTSANNAYRPAIGIARLYNGNNIKLSCCSDTANDISVDITSELHGHYAGRRSASIIDTYFNGDFVNSIASDGGNLLLDNTCVAFGGVGHYTSISNRFLTGRVKYGLLWGRLLTPEEIAWQYEEPYTFIIWPSRRVIFDFGASPSIISVSDTLSASDAVNATAHYSVSVSDGFTSADTVDPIASYLSSITEALNLTDTVSPARALLTSVSDSVTFSDSTSALLALIASTADTLSISESIAVRAALVAILADNLDLSDIAEYAGSAVASVIDTLQVSDSTGVLASLIASASDGVSLSDALLGGISATLSDSVAYSDSANAVAHFITSLVEQLNFVDSADYIGGSSILVSDGLNFADSASAVGHFVVNITDEMSISESTSVLARYLATIADSLTLSDVVRIDSDLAHGVVTISFGAKAPRITFKVRK